MSFRATRRIRDRRPRGDPGREPRRQGPRDAQVLREARGVGRGRAARDWPRSATSPATARSLRSSSTRRRPPCASRGPGTRSRGRWRAATRCLRAHARRPVRVAALCAIFLLGLLDWRRPWRLVHLDLVVLLAFGVSHVFFNRGEIGLSVPLVYPVLLYLLARLARGSASGPRPGAVAVGADRVAGDRRALIGSVRAQPRRLGRDRRRLLERDRRRPRPSAGSRCTARSSPTTTRSATPTARSTTTPTFPSSSPSRGPASGTSSRPATRRRLLRPRGRRPVARGRPAAATRPPRPRPRRRVGVRVGRVPVHGLRAAVERQRLTRRADSRSAPAAVLAAGPRRGRPRSPC